MSFGPPPNRSGPSLSVTGEHLHTSASSVTPPKKTYQYKCVSHSSSVDETLFSSHRDQNSARPGSTNNHRPGSANKRTDSTRTLPRTNSAMSTTPPIKSSLNQQRPSSRSGYRVKYPKSYVDEMLFGPQLETPSFDAPWDDKEDKKRGPVLMWSPPVPGSLLALASTPEPDLRPRSSAASRPSSAAASRPLSAAGSRPSSAAGRKRPSTPTKAPWK